MRKQLQQKGQENVKKAAALVIRGFLDQVFNNPLLRNDKIKLIFTQAGWPASNAQLYYLIAKVVSLFLAFSLAFWLTMTFSALDNYLLIVYVAAALIGWSLFDWILQSLISSRIEKVENGLASALDLMLICVGSGLSFQKSMERVAREISPFNKEVSKELAITSIELEILLDTRQALTNLTERVPSPIIKSFAMTIVQSIQQGTHIVKALDAIAHMIRQDRLQMAEVKAARLPSLLVIPLVLFTLPNIFIILLGPSLIRVLTVLKAT
jgi:tight adherence protein C